jgi:hypothetical protein
MTNYKVFNNRRRHEYLAKPRPKRRVKRRSAQRVGLLDAWARNGKVAEPEAAPTDDTEEQP